MFRRTNSLENGSLYFSAQGGGALALQFPGTGAKLEKQHYYIKFDDIYYDDFHNKYYSDYSGRITINDINKLCLDFCNRDKKTYKPHKYNILLNNCRDFVDYLQRGIKRRIKDYAGNSIGSKNI